MKTTYSLFAVLATSIIILFVSCDKSNKKGKLNWSLYYVTLLYSFNS